MGRLQVIEFLLLSCIEQRTDLRHGAGHYRLGFLHRVRVDGAELRFGLIENRLNLCLLIRREAQCLGQVFETQPLAMPPARTALRLRNGEAAERDRTYGSECE